MNGYVEKLIVQILIFKILGGLLLNEKIFYFITSSSFHNKCFC
jgi:hypothetical protein